jgi:hypothetical protein
MSILVKAGEQYLQISDDDLARCMISPQEFETKSADGAVADRSLLFTTYSEAVQIGCGCCMSKKSYGASCR